MCVLCQMRYKKLRCLQIIEDFWAFVLGQVRHEKSIAERRVEDFEQCMFLSIMSRKVKIFEG